MKRVRVEDQDTLNLNSDLLEYTHNQGTPGPSKSKRVCMALSLIGAISLCILSITLLVLIAILYGLIQSSVIPWGSRFCDIEFTVPNRNITGTDLFRRYHQAFQRPPFCNSTILTNSPGKE